MALSSRASARPRQGRARNTSGELLSCFTLRGGSGPARGRLEGARGALVVAELAERLHHGAARLGVLGLLERGDQGAQRLGGAHGAEGAGGGGLDAPEGGLAAGPGQG